MTDKVYEFLNAPRHTLLQIQDLSAKIEALEDSLLPSGIRYDADKVQTSPKDPVPEIMAKIDDLDRQVKALQQKVAGQAKDIGDACRKLERKEE